MEQNGRHAIVVQILRAEGRSLISGIERLESEVKELSREVQELRRKDEELIAQLAGLKRLHYDRRLPRMLSRIRRLTSRRRKTLGLLARYYRVIAGSPLFDAKWYLANNPDLAASKVDPVLHYLLDGSAEGRSPGPNFDATAYLDANPDVAGSKQNTLLHYLLHGHRERRKLSPDPQFLTSRQNPALRVSEIELSLAVPFRYVTETRMAEQRIAAVVHIFYDDLATELRYYLQNIGEHTDVYISTTDRTKKSNIENSFSSWTHGGVEVRVTVNRGRNLGPALVEFKDVYRNSDIILHVHSKKSSHSSNLSSWRYYLLETLCGNPLITSSILDAFQRNKNLGIVAASDFIPIREWVSWGPNFQRAEELALKMGFRIEPSSPVHFPSGAMFWARSEALGPLLDLDLTKNDFEPEEAQSDGTLAHAIERLIFYACERAGFKWMKVSRADLLLEPLGVVQVATPEDVAHFLRGNLSSR